MNLSTLLFANLTTRTIGDGTNTWTPPTLTFGESITLGLRLQEESGGSTIAASPNVTALKAAIGAVDARPLGGTFALQIGSAGTTGALPWNAGAVSMQIAINALAGVTAAYGQAAVVAVNDSYLITFPTHSGQVPLTVVNNTLWPVSFGCVTAWEVSGAWVQSLRLTQAPLAFTDASAAVLPPAPSISEVQPGGSDGGTSWNEIQALFVPPNFLGTYYLKFGNARTSLLDVSDGNAEIQAALVTMSGGGSNFTVTNPTSFTANIEFTGIYAGAAQSLLQVVVESAPPGDLTFTLNLGMGEMAAALRAQPSITAPLQITLTVEDDSGIASEVILYLPTVTIQRSLIFPELAEVPAIDWLVPPSPKSYVPFDPSQVITGQQYYQAVVGDGASTSFVIAHGLATEVVFVFARVNASNGRQLVDGTDFSVVINSANQVTVTALSGAPAANAWAVYVMSAQTVGAFATGLVVTIGQVTGLQAALNGIGTQLGTITALLPTAPPSINTTGSGTAVTINIPDLSEMFPGHAPAGNSGLSPTGKLPRPGALLPAINTLASAIGAGTFPLGTPSAGAIYQNQTGAAVLIDGGLGRDSAMLAPYGYVASDGRVWYRISQSGSTNSFFPTDFERCLFVVDVNDAMLSAGSALTLNFNVLLKLLQANTRAQYMVVVECGDLPQDTSPSPVAANLQNVVWNTAAPMLAQRVILSGVGVTHSFGISISRNSLGTILIAQRNLYGVWTGGAQTPVSANFALRARLIQFDTEDSVIGAKGTVYYALSGGVATIAR